MLLTVDIGNTNIVLGLFDGTGADAALLHDWRMRTDSRMTADEMALTFRDANCAACHGPEGHVKMNKLVLMQTPVHAASHIDAILVEIRSGKMPVEDYGDPVPIGNRLRQRLLADGESFKHLIDAADAWERDHNRPKARPAPSG